MSTSASHLQCLCGLVHESATLLASTSLPLDTELCHCATCRHSTGSLYSACVRLTGKPTCLEACTRYSRPGGTIDRYFCTGCGTRTFDHDVGEDVWFACAGTIEPEGGAGNVVRVVAHMFLEDTGDGGLATALQRVGGRDIPCFPQRSGQDPPLMSRDLTALVAADSKAREEKLFVSCHCASVQFYILPPQSLSDSVHTDPAISRWLRADNTKYLALNCACRYCRLATGCSIASNIYVMPENIVSISTAQSLFDYTSHDTCTSEFASSTPTLRAALPALKFDFSSSGIRRSFCGACGASVFFERASRPQCVNIAVGLLRAESGVLARRWIEFDWEVWWKEFAVDGDIVDALEAQR